MKRFLKALIPDQFLNLFWHLPKSVLAAIVYGFPGKKLTIIGVAGTKGKTSTAYYISHFLDRAEKKNVLFTTAVIKLAGKESLNSLKLTTPTPFFLQSLLRKAVSAECTHAVLEISSHGIKQSRFWGTPLKHIVITNLSPDHLEYHGTETDYRNTHVKLVQSTAASLVLNGDDPHLANFPQRSDTVLFSASSEQGNFLRQKTPLAGSFNLANLLAAFTVCRSLGIDEQTLYSAVNSITSAPGRMERINGMPFDIIVDYAHSPESLTSFFNAIRPTVQGKIIAVFGACGDRDKTKRPIMGSILDTLCDMLVITNDDPYSEDPQDIAEGLLRGIGHKEKGRDLFIELDRKEAIRKALSLAEKNDCVCVLGKGAEQWQVFKTKKIPWDDRHVIKEMLVDKSK